MGGQHEALFNGVRLEDTPASLAYRTAEISWGTNGCGTLRLAYQLLNLLIKEGIHDEQRDISKADENSSAQALAETLYKDFDYNTEYDLRLDS